MNRNDPPVQYASLFRRLAAMFYDLWLHAGILLLGATADTFIRAGLDIEAGHFVLPLQLFFVLAPLAFYLWFWTHGGQSLGMRAWKLRVVTDEGRPLAYKDALVRYMAACLSLAALGLGFAWQLWDRDGLTWHDRLSGTRLIRADGN